MLLITYSTGQSEIPSKGDLLGMGCAVQMLIFSQGGEETEQYAHQYLRLQVPRRDVSSHSEATRWGQDSLVLYVNSVTLVEMHYI